MTNRNSKTQHETIGIFLWPQTINLEVKNAETQIVTQKNGRLITFKLHALQRKPFPVCHYTATWLPPNLSERNQSFVEDFDFSKRLVDFLSYCSFLFMVVGTIRCASTHYCFLGAKADIFCFLLLVPLLLLPAWNRTTVSNDILLSFLTFPSALMIQIQFARSNNMISMHRCLIFLSFDEHTSFPYPPLVAASPTSSTAFDYQD
mmetsp:Transcript_13800/g.28990  ORF Transcript_13800/g.28990 Transcript_13800/m.28990 type:complete len:204 (+) Transcript_13800:984-1595(+)